MKEQTVLPGGYSGDLIRWVEDPAGSERVGGTSVGHALTRVVYCKTINAIHANNAEINSYVLLLTHMNVFTITMKYQK